MSTALTYLTIVHVAVSLIAIALGTPAILHIMRQENHAKSVFAYFVFTALTTISGFAFPIKRFTPGIAFGLLTLILLFLAWLAASRSLTSHRWQLTYLYAALGALYLNCVVLIVQSFMKIQVLHSLAPTQSEWPFLAAQVILLIPFVAVVWKSLTGRVDKRVSSESLVL